MGSGIEAARSVAPEHAQAIDDMKDQLLIALIRRLGGKVAIPVSEVDDTGGVVLLFHVDYEEHQLCFELQDKQ